MDEQVNVNVIVPVEMDIKLRRVAAERRISKSDVVREAIEALLKVFGELPEVVSVEILPGPEGCTPVPVITVMTSPPTGYEGKGE